MDIQKKNTFPPQHQDQQPGKESAMTPRPQYDNPNYKPSGKLDGKTALVTGGDSGIGRAVALAFAKEGADVAIVYLNEHQDASETENMIAAQGRRCLNISADLRKETAVMDAVAQVTKNFGRIDILINNAAVQYPQNSILDITKEQLIYTFESNIFSYFYMTKVALASIPNGGAIVNTASIVAFDGDELLIDYASTKGAIVSFTRSLALSLMTQNIKVNAVSPGPVWTPLIVSSFPAEHVQTFGSNTPMQRAAQPYELAPAYVFLCCEDSSNITGQVLHVNSGTIIN